MLKVSDVRERTLYAPAALGEVIIIRAGGSYDGKQGMSLATGVSSRSAGARGLCLHLVNRSDVTTIAVVARTDPREQESVVTLSLSPHLAGLDAFPVAAG